MSTKQKSYRIVRRAGEQGTRPSVTSQAGVGEKYVTGCDSMSLSTRTPGTRNNLSNNTYKVIRLATINVRTLQDDFKLACIVKAAEQFDIDVLAMQEVRRTSYDSVTLEDESLKGWKLIWSGHKRKHEHGVGFLLAPHVRLEATCEHLT